MVASARRSPWNNNDSRDGQGIDHQRMKSLLDFVPLLVFFGGYYGAKQWPDLADTFINVMLGLFGLAGPLPADQLDMACATQLAMLATLAQVGILIACRHKVDKILWITLVIVVVMSIATLIFHDPAIIKWRSTVLDWLFGLILLGGEVLFGKNLIRAMLGAQIDLPDNVWRHLNFSWIGYFALSGVLNLIVAARFSEETWVNFNMFGGPALTVLFMLGQGFYMSRFMEPSDESR
jgi:intracellular septation protein